MTSNACTSVTSLWIWSLLVLLFTSPGLSTNPIVQTDKGPVRGKRLHLPHGKQVDAFYGIPYAKPPLGDLRFRHPQSIDKWDGIYDASELPNACTQAIDTVFAHIPGFKGSDVWNPNTPTSEDCLYLNVWAPLRTSNFNDKAVMIWIYGGSFSYGSSALDVYNAKYLAAENDIIVVSMQYRLGSLGFLSFGDPEAPGNAGLFDQLFAIEWVQRNIHMFGGNSHNVTLFGESVGAASVGIHMLSPRSRDKFQRAILQSGAPHANWATVTQTEAIRRAQRLAKYFNCSHSDTKETVKCLRKKNANEFQEKEFLPNIVQGIEQFPFTAMIDGVLILESPNLALRNNHFKKTPILIGTNTNEGSYFFVYSKPDAYPMKFVDHLNLSKENFEKDLNHYFRFYPQYPKHLNSFGIEAIRFQYTPWKNVHDQILNAKAIDQAFGDLHFVCPTVDFADRYAIAGLPVYHYRFEHRTTHHHWPEWMGVLHGDEIAYVFGEPMDATKNYTHVEKKISKKMMKYWTNFAKTGDPNKELIDGQIVINDDWPIYTIEERQYLKITSDIVHDHRKQHTIGIGPKLQECAFWTYYLPNLVRETADISEVEKQWKVKFADWATHYDNFMTTYESRLQSCSSIP